MNNANHWIDALQMQKHPEGGWFREIYRSSELISHGALPRRFTGDRCFSTAIYFLLQETDFSALHRIQQDEVWHFYDGSTLTIHQINPEGEYSTIKLGRDVRADEKLVAVVPAGWLFGASLADPSSYALVGCTVAPGFDFADFEMPSRQEILEQYPKHQSLIERLTRT